MAYVNWVIGGLTPNWVEPDFKDDRPNKTLTLKCAAIRDEIGVDPVIELDQFNDISSERIINTSLENGGTNLQVVDGHIFSVTADSTTWERCALRRVSVLTDDGYDGDNPGSVLEYELVIEYEVRKGGGVFTFTPDPPNGYHKYAELEFYEWYYENNGVWVKENAVETSGAYGTEIGYMKLTAPKPIKSITFYGSACLLPAKIYVPGSIEGSRDWIYSHDDNQNQPFQEQKFTFDPVTAPTILEAYTSGHSPTDNPNHGAWLKWVRVEYI